MAHFKKDRGREFFRRFVKLICVVQIWTTLSKARRQNMHPKSGWRPVWPDLAKFRHFVKKFQALGKFLTVYFYLAKCLAYFGKFVTLLG